MLITWTFRTSCRVDLRNPSGTCRIVSTPFRCLVLENCVTCNSKWNSAVLAIAFEWLEACPAWKISKCPAWKIYSFTYVRSCFPLVLFIFHWNLTTSKKSRLYFALKLLRFYTSWFHHFSAINLHQHFNIPSRALLNSLVQWKRRHPTFWHIATPGGLPFPWECMVDWISYPL